MEVPCDAVDATDLAPLDTTADAKTAELPATENLATSSDAAAEGEEGAGEPQTEGGEAEPLVSEDAAQAQNMA